ncbi:MAG: glycosyltransferase [Candidatus Coatesbacteria bacterium]|nr:glycosyltransferase [Candidatus Coatesbacteria bacterium]
MARVAVIIPNYNGIQLLKRCLDSLAGQNFSDFEALVVDDASTDGSAEFIRAEYPEVGVIQLEENAGFATAVNAGIRATSGEFVAILNNDTEVEPDWLSRLLGALDAHQDAGSAASKILWDDPRDTIYAAGDFFCREGFGGNIATGETDRGQRDEPGWVFSASACAALYRRAMLDEIGLFDEQLFMFYEDIDLGFREQLAGWRCIYVPGSVVYHTGTATAGIFSDMRKFQLIRNELVVLAKNLPGPILRSNIKAILRQQFRASIQALDEGRTSILLKARFGALKALPYQLKARRHIQSMRRVDPGHLEQMIRPYEEYYPPKEAQPGEWDVPAGEPSTGRRILIIRSAGRLLSPAIEYARSGLGANAIDVLVMPGFEDTIPTEDGIRPITYPGRGRFCGITMPRSFARRLRKRGYDTTIVLRGGASGRGFLNIDLVALRAGARDILYFNEDGPAHQFSRWGFAGRLARSSWEFLLILCAFTISVALLLAIWVFGASDAKSPENPELDQ